MRRSAWFVKKPCRCHYGFSGNNFKHQHPQRCLTKFWEYFEDQIPEDYNSVYCTLYVNQEAGVGYHSDDEKMLFEEGRTVGNQETTIASISLYGTRLFSIRPIQKITDPKTNASTTTKKGVQSAFRLEPLDIVIMEGLFQDEFQHAILEHHQHCGIRINFTFRQIKNHCKKCPLAEG